MLLIASIALPAPATDKQHRVGFLTGTIDWDLHTAGPHTWAFGAMRKAKNVVYRTVASTALTDDKLPVGQGTTDTALGHNCTGRISLKGTATAEFSRNICRW
ncbi:MAG: hypothetical protein OET44_00275 [Gammaproteobacteria bacterium]|nr:hypothetical protein [Gammaproteobacteria bacterium]